ncbi:MAG: threonine-phosphate decarboxylase CobD [Methylotenera sp.]|uniref:threonine-phosphate decarboxylase CobD n=1 Tax=Methylotenera sp. TaxID=2051956 RepID=UPI00248854AA|nr:threonine-phosphate decarboxylase CobD [Methylotenera sp.]MDI1308188.1 threonine-phosphate decarboxylase CobD [Methylotenera sp.]
MLEHGGNLAAAAKRFNIPLEHWLDLSTGINPDGYPITEIPAAVWQKLPLEDDGLIEAACEYYGCQLALPTAGSQAALQLLPQLRAASKVAMPKFMYQEHANAWQANGHEVIKFDFFPDENIIQQADVLLLCNPNNPTATRFSVAELLSWHATLAARGGWLVVDEAFMDVTPEHGIAKHSHLKGLLVLRSLGKFFGLAGARVGFLLAEEQMLRQMQEFIGPWSITGPSRLIAKQALLDKAWQEKMRVKLTGDSQKLAVLLTKYKLTPMSGTALFQFVPTKDALALQQHLAQQGIWIRLFSDAPGLSARAALRFGLPPTDGWARLESALKLWQN